MPVIVALALAFLTGLVLTLKGYKPLNAWLLSCCILPAFVVFAEFLMPYQGGGASMWPIALFFGTLYGAAAGGAGVGIAWLVRDHSEQD